MQALRMVVVMLAVVSWGAGASAFSLLPDPRQGSVEADLSWAARWSPESDPFGWDTGFHDGIQVAVAHDVAARLEITEPEEVDLLRKTIVRAFDAWAA